MNLIICDQNCRHQKDGYCSLNHMTQLTGSVRAGCGYYQKRQGGKEKPSPEKSEGLR